jgi:hypothetical protein
VTEAMKMLNARLIFLVITLAFVFGPVFFVQADSTSSPRAESRWLIEESRLASSDLKIDWQYNLPLSDTESISRMRIFANRLFILSDRNYLTCLNRADGNVIFSNFIEKERLPYIGLEYYKGLLITLVGSKVVEVNTEY